MKFIALTLVTTALAFPAFAQTDLQSIYDSPASSSLSNVMGTNKQAAVAAAPSNNNFIAPVIASNVQLPKEKFVTNRGSGGWEFLMGPETSINEELMFYSKPDKNGGASFICRRSQDNGMILVLNKETKPFTKPVTVEISIDGDAHPQEMNPGPSGEINKEHEYSLMFVGDAGVAILKAMANTPSGKQADMVVKYKDKIISTTQLPGYSSLPYQAANICLGWNELKHAAQMEHENIPPTQAHVIGVTDNAATSNIPK